MLGLPAGKTVRVPLSGLTSAMRNSLSDTAMAVDFEARLRNGCSVGVGVIDGVWVTVAEAVPVGVPVGVPVWVTVADAVPVGVAVPVPVGERLAFAVRLAVR